MITCLTARFFNAFRQLIKHFFLFIQTKFCNFAVIQIQNNMNTRIVGREQEIAAISKYIESGRPEFLAIYGRRRVGKTFLVDQVLAKKICFSVSGSYKEPRNIQLQNFAFELASRTGNSKTKKLKSWTEAFWELGAYLDAIRKNGQRQIIFIDELPWLDTPKSGFVRALDYFWNHYASKHNEIMLVACGSATSWMVNTLINDKGGLHNRVTREMHICPFSLNETEQYLKKAGFKWPRYIIAQVYMIMGGVPYYMDMLSPDETFSENIDRLFFSPNAQLKSEYGRLYTSLFGRKEKYMSIISQLAKCKEGLTLAEIANNLKLQQNGNLSQVLEDLVNCDFLRYYNVKGKNIHKTGGIYQLVDLFTLFHFAFLTKKSTSAHYWSEKWASQELSTWRGLAFERLCMSHIQQIKKALHIDGIYTEHFSWRSKNSETKAQIDLIIERADRMTHVCEMKFAQDSYTITKKEHDNIRKRIEAYRTETGTKNGMIMTMVTTMGLTKSTYNCIVDKTICLDDLFMQ